MVLSFCYVELLFQSILFTEMLYFTFICVYFFYQKSIRICILFMVVHLRPKVHQRIWCQSKYLCKKGKVAVQSIIKCYVRQCTKDTTEKNSVISKSLIFPTWSEFILFYITNRNIKYIKFALYIFSFKRLQ